MSSVVDRIRERGNRLLDSAIRRLVLDLTVLTKWTNLTPVPPICNHLSRYRISSQERFATPQTRPPPLIHTPRPLHVPSSITRALPQPLRKPNDPRRPIRMFCPLPQLSIVLLLHLDFEKPLLGRTPDFDQREVPGVLGVDEDVEEHAVWFVGAGGPDGAMALFPLRD